MIKKFKQFCQNNNGNTAIVFALAIVPLLLSVGVSVDMVRANRAQIRMQAAADAAALAAGAEVKENGVTSVNAVVTKLVADFATANDLYKSVDVIESVDTKIDKKTGKLMVTVKGKMKTSLMSMAGFATMDVNAKAEVGFSGASLEIALVLDNTGSMSGSKLSSLKNSARQLVQTIFDKQDNYETLKMAVVPFSEYVNVGLANAGAPWVSTSVTGSPWEGCVGSPVSPQDESIVGVAAYPRVGGVRCVSELLPLTNNRTLIESRLDAMVAEGATFIPAGITWGWHALTPTEPLSGGMTDSQMASKGGRKAMIIMTDGANTISPNAPFHNGADVTVANQLTTTVCANAKADNIQVFTVAFDLNNVTIKAIL